MQFDVLLDKRRGKRRLENCLSVKWIFHVHTFLMFCFHSILFPLQVRLVREMKSKFSFSASFQRPTRYSSVFAQLARGRKPAGYLFTLQRAKVTSCLGEVVINTLYGHGNTIKRVSQAIVMVYLPYLVVITMAMITMATITMAAIIMVAVYFLSLLSHIATWTVYSTIMLGVRLLWVCVWRTADCSICLFICNL